MFGAAYRSFLVFVVFLIGVLSRLLRLGEPVRCLVESLLLERVFPNMVQSVPQAGIIIVMGKIRLNENGVLEGTGPAADKVKDIYQRYVTETQLAQQATA